MSFNNDGLWPRVATQRNTPNRVLSPFETWPPFIFYAPIAIWWMLLSVRYLSATLPSLANSSFPGGGLLTEPKSVMMSGFGPTGRSMIARYTTFANDASAETAEMVKLALDAMAKDNIAFPVVAKPEVGRNGAGVKKVANAEALKKYLTDYPKHGQIMLQEFSPYKGEAGIFYVRYPGEEVGTITSLTLKFFPFVTGDGKSTLRQLIEADPRAGQVTGYYFPRLKDQLDDIPVEGEEMPLVFTGNHCSGALFKDGGPHVTEAMFRKIEEISQEVDGFWFGRYDIRYRDLEALKRGEDFTIIEVNGAGAEAVHIWDSNMRLRTAYHTLFIQYRTAFEIGAAARKRGLKPVSAGKVIKQFLSEILMLRILKKL